MPIMLITGIKSVDLLCPYLMGGKIGLFTTGDKVGQHRFVQDLISHKAKYYNGYSVCVEVGTKIKSAKSLY